MRPLLLAIMCGVIEVKDLIGRHWLRVRLGLADHVIRPRNKTQLSVSAESAPIALQRPRRRRQAMCHCRLAALAVERRRWLAVVQRSQVLADSMTQVPVRDARMGVLKPS